jgi:C4-dicarboxylate transporter, DctM subunit
MITLTLTVIGLLVVLLLGFHVAAAIGFVSLSLMLFLSDRPLWDAISFTTWKAATSFSLMAAPLFVLMGELLLRSGTSERMYSALSKWLNPIPGGLLHSNIAACSIFAACSGSSVATAATVGSVALPAFGSNRYDPRIVLGSLAAGGTLGILIPPSVNLVVYGVLAGASIRELFLAAVIPGLAMSALFMLAIYVMARINPRIAAREAAGSWAERFAGLLAILPMLVIIFAVLGTMYFGVATPTEAAAFGVIAAFLVALVSGGINRSMLRATFTSTAITSAMIMLIFMATAMLQFVLGHLGIPARLAASVTAMGLSATEVVLVILLFYFVLGMFMEAFSMTVATIPIIVPMLTALNVDLVWFGVIVVIMTELALISPPVGLNLFVLQGLREQLAIERGEPVANSMMDIYIGVMPFLGMQLVTLALVMVFPAVTLWLPAVLRQ